MTKKMAYRWQLRERMAERGWWKTTDLTPLLAERGIHLSAAQTYRLVAHTPERLSLDVLAALCDILACTPADLIEVHPAEPNTQRTGTDDTIGDITKIRAGIRPKRARIT
jgi:DNA-binding Xre family transcriptional regulator